jgi:hypothetical protein
MRFSDITEETVTEARMVWRRMGNTVKRAVRCTAGPRKGRVVSKASQCTAPVNIKRRLTLKKSKAKFGSRMTKKARRTKRVSPASRRVRALNR